MGEVNMSVEAELIDEHKVGISQWKVVPAPHRMITLGLGSCVGVVLYDSVMRIGGMSHIMLPDSSQFKRNDNKGKFADTAIPMLLEEMQAIGARKRVIIARIAGGAQMFSSEERKAVNNIGHRNVEKTFEVLDNLGIKVLAKDVGGNKGRTMIFDTADGSVWIRMLGQKTRLL